MSTLSVNNIQPANAGSETYFLPKSWVNFNGTGTVAIRQDGNVSSITDGGVGVYTVVFSTALTDASYSPTFSYTNEVNGQHAVGFISGIVAAGFTVQFYNAANSANTADKSIVSAIAVR